MDAQPKYSSTMKGCLIGVGICFGIFIILLIVGSFMQDADEDQTNVNPQADSVSVRKQMIEKQFSSWDGSHVKLTMAIKKSMNDPDSYEHVETKYWDLNDHLVVRTEFRGKNGFGGLVLQSVKAKVGLNGDVIEIIEVN